MRAPLLAGALLGLSHCGGREPEPEPARDILDRLDAIDRRLSALEARASDDPRPIPPDPIAADGEVHDLHDPTRPAARGSLKISVTRTGFEVEGRTLTEAQLEIMLRGVDSVTVRGEQGLPTDRLTSALDLVARSGIKRVAVATFSAPEP